MSIRPEWDAWAAVGVTVHLRPGVTLGSTIHAEERRVVLHVQGTNSTDVALFANQADLDRLVDAVTAARDQLTAGMAAIESTTASTAAANAA